MRKILLPILTGVIGVCAVIYAVGALWFSGHFYPGTIINGTEISHSGIEAAKAEYEGLADKYVLNILERQEKTEEINASDINLAFSISDEMENLKKQQGNFDWIFRIFGKKEYTMNVRVSYDENLLQDKFESLDLVQNMSAPVDAQIKFNETTKQFEIVPENNGTTIRKDESLNLIKSAIFSLQSQVDIESSYENAQIKSDNETLNANCVTMNQYIKPVITYQFGTATEVVDVDRIKDWLAISEDNQVIFDAAKVDEFINYIGRTYNTFGNTRSFKTSYGSTVNVEGGDYGWWLNRGAERDSLVAAIKAGESITKEPVYYQKAAQYGNDDIGNSYAEVNLTTQHMFIYINGQMVLESDFVSGNPNRGRETPTGTYSITYKELDATLNGENYSTPVKYWMPFNMDVGFHDAIWQSSFGGTRYLTNGSHGCINLPLDVAQKLYSYVYKGMPVIVYKMDTATVTAATNQTTSAEA